MSALPANEDSQAVEMLAVIRSRNANPGEISDRAVIYSDRSIELRLVEGTVEETDNLGSRYLPDQLAGGREVWPIGDINGCFDFVRLITAKFAVIPSSST